MSFLKHFPVGCAAVLIAFIGSAFASPRVPADDSEILERLAVKPGDPFRAETAALREFLAREPRNVESAARLARLHIDRARSDSDPRQLGQAQAALAAWWNETDPPPRIQLLRATIRQSNHDFAAALADLARVTQREPGNAQAWLTLATVQQVTGDSAASRSSCRRLAAIAPPLVLVTCLASIEGANGNAGAALQGLSALLNASSSEPAAVRGWATTLEAELAERLSKTTEAEAHFKRALIVDPADGYAIAAYADFLLDEGRPREAMSLVGPDTASDPLLLRYVIAARSAAAGDADSQTRKLAERFAASRARGDRVHLREEARFTLEVLKEPAKALELARENWKVQKEPADARIALEAAVAARDPESVREVLQWLAATRLEGRRIAVLASTLERK